MYTYSTSKSNIKFLSPDIKTKCRRCYVTTVWWKLIATMTTCAKISPSLCAVGNNTTRLHYHCVIHQLNLLCQDACTEFTMASHVTSIVNKIVMLVKESPQPCAWFAAIQASTAEPTTIKLQSLCSKQWVLHKDCIDAFLVNCEL